MMEHHPEVKKLVGAWMDKLPYAAIWDYKKLADDITRCMQKINKEKDGKKKIKK